MKKNKNVLLFIAGILVISIVSGFIYGLNNSINMTDYLETLRNRNNLYLVHSLSIIIVFFSTLSLINVISESIILSIEGISIGFSLSILFKSYKMNGLFFGIVSVIVNKLLFLILLSYLFFISMRYINKIVKNVVGTSNDYIRSLLKPLIERFLLILIISLINDTIIYFFGNMFLNYLTFML